MALKMLSPDLVRLRGGEVLRRLPREGRVRGAEIGVAYGQLSACLLARADLSLVMVDSWLPAEAQPASYRLTADAFATLSLAEADDNANRARWATDFAKDRRLILRLDSTDAARAVPLASLDFVFIDADHSYAGVTADLAAWCPRLKPGGLLGGHDYVVDRPVTNPHYGVNRAVDEWVAARGWPLDLGANDTWFVRLPDAE